MHAVICGIPNPPLRGFIDRILTDASNGTDVVFYQCNPGLLPEGELRAVCTSNGSWYPDPIYGPDLQGTVVCTSVFHGASNSSLYT